MRLPQAIDVLSVRHRPVWLRHVVHTVGTRTHKLRCTTAFIPSGPIPTGLPATGSGSWTHQF